MCIYFVCHIPEDNSLSNLGTLRGVFGAHPRVRMRKISLARYPLSMRKPCLESYTLERTPLSSDLITKKSFVVLTEYNLPSGILLNNMRFKIYVLIFWCRIFLLQFVVVVSCFKAGQVGGKLYYSL